MHATTRATRREVGKAGISCNFTKMFKKGRLDHFLKKRAAPKGPEKTFLFYENTKIAINKITTC
jgi:hypothetical protein